MGSGIQVAQAFKKGKSTDRGPHLRHAFTISGCSPTVYQVIKGNEHNAYMTLLAPYSRFFQENPRQDSKNVVALRRLKPFWSHGSETYGWAASGRSSNIGATVLESGSHAVESEKVVEHVVPAEDDVEMG
ncbi:hypothetical protein BDP27DRAFT_479799 [Rhodocollybia butyracea]|uniref:Uncharacterized protein n=1 Tax=Rhodocollybia butyracea TaxID=206335 RepID=A0A9P5UFT1_9AGAR|nr:hypothetical protein BDP27DRAFT_479799 [Rhodocollybia butyracea]